MWTTWQQAALMTRYMMLIFHAWSHAAHALHNSFSMWPDVSSCACLQSNVAKASVAGHQEHLATLLKRFSQADLDANDILDYRVASAGMCTPILLCQICQSLSNMVARPFMHAIVATMTSSGFMRRRVGE